MTNTCLTLDGVSCVLPDGRTLFSGLHHSFDLRHTGLVGRNGVGKTLLVRILAGELEPSAGRCVRACAVHHLAQQVAPGPGATVADLAGVGEPLAALARIEAGSVAPTDFETLADRWDIRQRLQAELARGGLGALSTDTPASALSGGEAMRVALAGAMLSDAGLLLLDEPSNHLDSLARAALRDVLRRWSRGLIVVSHDRELLETMDCIVELSSQGLHAYGGPYSFYAGRKAEEQAAAAQTLEQRRQERQRELRALAERHEQSQRRQAQGRQRGREANQAKILLGRQKERGEASAGQVLRQQAATRAQLDARVREAAAQVGEDRPLALHSLPAGGPVRRRVAVLEQVVLPRLPPSAATRAIDLVLLGHQRVGVVGANGCGKSTLLQVLAGQLAPVAGRRAVAVPWAYLDQRLGGLAPDRTVLAQALQAESDLDESHWRMQLDQLGLDASRLALPSARLSGGERLKAALALALYATRAGGSGATGDSGEEGGRIGRRGDAGGEAGPGPQLLLLDEPGNHLDLPSLEALEALLRDYRGALVVVSHDTAFLRRLDLTDRLEATPEGWRLQSW